MNQEPTSLDEPAQSGGLKELAYWTALIIANVACLGLMALLLLR